MLIADVIPISFVFILLCIILIIIHSARHRFLNKGGLGYSLPYKKNTPLMVNERKGINDNLNK